MLWLCDQAEKIDVAHIPHDASKPVDAAAAATAALGKGLLQVAHVVQRVRSCHLQFPNGGRRLGMMMTTMSGGDGGGGGGAVQRG